MKGDTSAGAGASRSEQNYESGLYQLIVVVTVTLPVEQVDGVPAVQRGHHGVVGVEGGQPVLQPGPGAELPSCFLQTGHVPCSSSQGTMHPVWKQCPHSSSRTSSPSVKS